MMKVKPAFDEQYCIGFFPDVIEEHPGFSAREYQRDSVSMLRQASKPLRCFEPIRRIAPNATEPWL